MNDGSAKEVWKVNIHVDSISCRILMIMKICVLFMRILISRSVALCYESIIFYKHRGIMVSVQNIPVKKSLQVM